MSNEQTQNYFYSNHKGKRNFKQIYTDSRISEHTHKIVKTIPNSNDSANMSFLTKRLPSFGKLEGKRVFALVEYVEEKPLILSFHKIPHCKNLKKEAYDPDIKQWRHVIRNRHQLDMIDQETNTSEWIETLCSIVETENAQAILTLQEFIGTGNAYEFVAEDGSLHVMSPCEMCWEDSLDDDQYRFTVLNGYNICLIFLQRLGSLIENELCHLSPGIVYDHFLFFHTICSEAECYEEWHEAVYRVTQIQTSREPELAFRGHFGMEWEQMEKQLIKLSINEIFLSVIEFCKLYNTKFNSTLNITINLLESMKENPDIHSGLSLLWNHVVQDVMSGATYICNMFFWNMQFQLGRFPEDTPEARSLMQELFSDPVNKVGSTKKPDYRKDVYLKTLPDGKQLWGYLYKGEKFPERKNEIMDAGIDSGLIAWEEDPNHENGGQFVLLQKCT